MDLQNFLNMGGYAEFVWSAYGLTAVVLVANWVAARRREAEELASARRRTQQLKESRT
jgi:heme exporter protein CcmD